MRDIAIYGAGGLGREVACLIHAINKVQCQWNLIGFFDDGVEQGTSVSHFGNVIGNIVTLNQWKTDLDLVLAIGSPAIISKLVDSIDNSKVSFPNLIYPGIRISDEETFRLGKGNIIKHDCGFSCDITIGDFNLFNGGVTLGHDVKIGNCNVFMPDVRISGENHIGDRNFFGVSGITLQQINIGNNFKLGAASVLMRSPKNGELYMGNPAKLVKF